MKRLTFIIIAISIWGCMYSQVITKEEIERYTDLDGTSWTKRAKELSEQYSLNEKGELQLSIIKEFEGQTKQGLYMKILNWIISLSTEAESALQIADNENGRIVTRCYLPNIAKRTMGDNSYKVSIRPLLSFDFKDGRIRFTFLLQNYNVSKKNDDSGYVFMFGNGFGVTGNGVTKENQIWLLKDCYPFAGSKQGGYDDVYELSSSTNRSSRIKHPKVTSSRAFVNSISCYKILVDKIDEVVSRSLEDDGDW